jgi:hypothetical protein
MKKVIPIEWYRDLINPEFIFNASLVKVLSSFLSDATDLWIWCRKVRSPEQDLEVAPTVQSGCNIFQPRCLPPSVWNQPSLGRKSFSSVPYACWVLFITDLLMYNVRILTHWGLPDQVFACWPSQSWTLKLFLCPWKLENLESGIPENSLLWQMILPESQCPQKLGIANGVFALRLFKEEAVFTYHR